MVTLLKHEVPGQLPGANDIICRGTCAHMGSDFNVVPVLVMVTDKQCSNVVISRI
jgi:hypothetical protein